MASLAPSQNGHRRPLRIAMLAPPWIPVPPRAYGGIESVVALLCDGLVRHGHDVTLFAPPGSESRADVVTLLDRTHPDEINNSVHESDHVMRAVAAIEGAAGGARPFDVIHDHCSSMTLAIADRLDVPVVHTVHGPFSEDMCSLYEHHGHKARIVCLSRYQLERAPVAFERATVVPNPIEVSDWPISARKDDYLLWIGRMHPDKGAHRAIDAAREAGMPLVIAGPVQPGQEEYFRACVEPHVDGRTVKYLGEVGADEKRRLYAHARALLMPIRWPEPFGMVMVEALACGTPVIAFPEGAAPEIVRDGQTGFLVGDEEEMAARARAVALDPHACRADVLARFDTSEVSALYEEVYRAALDDRRGLTAGTTPEIAA